MSDYTQFNSQYPGREVIDGALWDTLLFTSAATTLLTFFNNTRATIDLSNMTQAGQLPSPDSFLVRAIRIFFKNRPESQNSTAAATVQTGSTDDIRRVLENAALIFNIGQKDYGIYPAVTIPAGGGVWGTMGISNVLIAGSNVDWANNGRPHIYNTFTLGKPVLIKSQINFNVQLFWNAALALVRNVNIMVVLDGDRIRAIQ